MNEVIKTIQGRRSVRVYRTEPVPEADLGTILQAGLIAPSAMNQQSAHLVALTGQGAARYRSYCQEKLGRDPYYGAPAIILVFGKEDAIAPVCDGSLAIANMMLAAASLGLGTCWVHCVNSLFADGKNAREWGVPEGHRPVGSIAVGFSAQSLTQAAPRTDGRVTRITE